MRLWKHGVLLAIALVATGCASTLTSQEQCRVAAYQKHHPGVWKHQIPEWPT